MSTKATGRTCKLLSAMSADCQPWQDKSGGVWIREKLIWSFKAQSNGLGLFILNGRPVNSNREESYKHLGFTFHATRNMAYGISQLTARKAMHAMRRQCAQGRLLRYSTVRFYDSCWLSGIAQQTKLFQHCYGTPWWLLQHPASLSLRRHMKMPSAGICEHTVRTM